MSEVADVPGARFRSSYDDLVLVEVVVPAVVEAAGAPDPLVTTQAAYDAAREAAGFPDAPSAAQTARRLGRPWREVLAMALEGPEPARALGASTRRPARRDLSEGEIVEALQRAARHAGKATLRPAEYDEIRDELVAPAQRAWLHGRDVDAIPTADQIRLAMRSRDDPEGWDSALAAAGLKPRGRSPRPASVDPIQATEWFLEDAGWLPASWRQLRDYAAAKGFSLKRPAGSIEDVHQELRKQRARAKWTPPGPPPAHLRPPFTVEPMFAPRAARATRRLAYEQAVEWVARALASLAGRERLTVRRYQRWSAKTPGAPSLSSIQRAAAKRGGTFKTIRAAAARIDPPRPSQSARTLDFRGRRRGRKPGSQLRSPPGAAGAPPSTLAGLVAAGVLDPAEKLIAHAQGRRWTATFNPDEGLDIDGLGHAHSLSEAARMIHGGPTRRNGWKVWRVEREGKLVRLQDLRHEALPSRR